MYSRGSNAVVPTEQLRKTSKELTRKSKITEKHCSRCIIDAGTRNASTLRTLIRFLVVVGSLSPLPVPGHYGTASRCKLVPRELRDPVKEGSNEKTIFSWKKNAIMLIVHTNSMQH